MINVAFINTETILLNVLFFFLLYLYLLSKINNSNRDCISLILPSTENDFFKCYKQMFYFRDSTLLAKEIIIAISSVTNITIIKNIVKQLSLKSKIILGIRKTKHNAASNRNYGFNLSRCNIISFFDIDDIMSVNRLSILNNIFSTDKTTEFVLHKFESKCNNINDINPTYSIKYKYNYSYKYIYNSYKNNEKNGRANNRWCCKFISGISHELIHNGWPTMRRYVIENIKYNEKYNSGQDSDFNARVILNGYNVTIMNISLGYYRKRNTCLNYTSCK